MNYLAGTKTNRTNVLCVQLWWKTHKNERKSLWLENRENIVLWPKFVLSIFSWSISPSLKAVWSWAGVILRGEPQDCYAQMCKCTRNERSTLSGYIPSGFKNRSIRDTRKYWCQKQYIRNYPTKKVKVYIMMTWCKVPHLEPYKSLTYPALI